MNSNSNALEAMKDGRKVVVIYYANDTYAQLNRDPAQQSLRALTSLLRKGANEESDANAAEKLRKLANRLENEWDDFNIVVNQNIEALRDRVCSNVGPAYVNSVAGLAVFRNRVNEDSMLATSSPWTEHERTLRWSLCRPGDQHLDDQYMTVPRINEFPYPSQPLSHPLVLKKALEAVREKFPPEKHRYVLITKSHGSKENALTPHISHDLRSEIENDGARLLEDIKKSDRFEELTLNGMKAMDPILEDVDEVIAQAKQTYATKGISKRAYLQILSDLGAGSESQSMKFPIVLMESCKSDLRYSSDPDIEWVLSFYPGQSYQGFEIQNVGLLYTSDEKGLGYNDVNYWELKGFRYNHFNDLQDIIKTFLDSKAKNGTGSIGQKPTGETGA